MQYIQYTSVIIPTHNRHHDLIDVLKALSDQTHLPDEILIYSSSNRYIAMEKKATMMFPKQRCRYIHTTKMGKAYKCNKAIDRVSKKSSIIIFLDDDCIPHEQWVSQILHEHVMHKNISVIGGGYKSYYQSYLNKFFGLLCYPTKKTQLYPFFFGGNITFKKTLFYDKSIRFNPNYQICEDWELAHTILSKGHKIYMIKTLSIPHKFRKDLKDILVRFIDYGVGEFYVHELATKHVSISFTQRMIQFFFSLPKTTYRQLADFVHLYHNFKFIPGFLIFQTCKHIGTYIGLNSMYRKGRVYPISSRFK